MTKPIHTAYSALYPDWPELRIECRDANSAAWLVRKLKHHDRYVIGDINENIVWVRYDVIGIVIKLLNLFCAFKSF